MITNGQTWHEYGKNIHVFSGKASLQSNLEVVFGKRWNIILFSPLISSPPCGDGMSFDVAMNEMGNTQGFETKRM